jgi:hypothetical protein
METSYKIKSKPQNEEFAMKVIGKDRDGITQISLEALKALRDSGEELEMVRIYTDHHEVGVMAAFFFSPGFGRIYEASGFGIGYGGEGPHGLWKAIRMWYPDKMAEDFWKTEISHLDPKESWAWTPDKGWEIITANG